MSNYILVDGVLIHHGTKGQRWGFRRFQNEDGTYTEEGKERRRRDYGKVAADVNKYGSATTKVISEVKNIRTKTHEPKRKKELDSAVSKRTKDLSEMSDSELQKYINRYNLEQQYKDIVKKQEAARQGKDKVAEILDTVGTVVGVATSAATIVSVLWPLFKSHKE